MHRQLDGQREKANEIGFHFPIEIHVKGKRTERWGRKKKKRETDTWLRNQFSTIRATQLPVAASTAATARPRANVFSFFLSIVLPSLLPFSNSVSLVSPPSIGYINRENFACHRENRAI